MMGSRLIIAVLAGLLTANVLADSNQVDVNQSDDISFDTLGMVISDEEKAAIQEAMHLGRKISVAAEKINGRPFRRDAHAKATGCVRAYFTVNGDIPARFQHSVFSQPGKQYKAWIRFSNGDMTVQPDGKPDARGMAIKIVEASGEKIAPELPGPTNQDLIMTNTPAFFHRNVFDYVDDMHYLAKLERTRWFISLFPPRLHPKRFYRAVQTVSAKITTPLAPQYYSMTPYSLGGNEIKFSAKPCSGMHFPTPTNTKDADYLTETMQSQLNNGAACFDFMVQEKIPGAHMPLDDATVIWSEEKSPFKPIAKIHIPPQDFASMAQNEFCENISMNPWRAVGEWEPLGSLNRSRRLVYHAVSQFRHSKNEANVVEPVSWCLDPNSPCDEKASLHIKKPTWPLPRHFDEKSTAEQVRTDENWSQEESG